MGERKFIAEKALGRSGPLVLPVGQPLAPSGWALSQKWWKEVISGGLSTTLLAKGGFSQPLGKLVGRGSFKPKAIFLLEKAALLQPWLGRLSGSQS